MSKYNKVGDKMSIGIEIIMYLIILLGMFVLTITFFDKKIITKDYYIRKKNKDSHVEIIIKVKGVSDEDADRIKLILEKGYYGDIYDIVDNFSVVNKNNWQNLNILIKYSK